ncbi:MAG: LemA family protein [Flavobacteriales bacterium]|jgi:LemA protein|nr:LemA family protein [Flavobacteriales bacterium]
MKRILLNLLLIAGLSMSFSSCGTYNSMVQNQESATSQWANVESAYQRRSDLIPNLVNTVKGYAEHEKSTLTEVIEARAKATKVTVDPSNITPEAMQKFQAAQTGLSGALSKLLVSVERYPDLKANQNFMALQTQLEGTENRINVERNRFNETVKTYNMSIKTFPNNMMAGMFGFSEMTYYKADAGSEKAPEVKF